MAEGKHLKRSNQGLTLMELLVAVFILSVGALAAVSSFKYISQSNQYSKARTLATNLAQEQIEKLKNFSYFTLLVTTSVYTDTRFSPAIAYDTGNYPSTTIIEGGITFTRATRVDFAYQNGTSISTASWTTDDTALKQITTYVMWQESGLWKYNSMQNLMANPQAVPMSASAVGTVKTPSNVGIAGALVQVIDNPNWFAYSNSSGNGDYRFSVSPGSYTLQASSSGYFTSTTSGYQSFTSGAATTVPFTLTQIASGTVTGNAYINNHLLVSQVVASTDVGNGSEYVELYNPTTAPVNIGSGGVASINLYIFDHTDNTVPTGSMTPVPLTYVSTYVPVNSYYLIANTTTIHAGGVTRQADAYYTSVVAPTHIIPQAEAGGLGIASVGPNRIDSLAWSKTASGHACPATPLEGACISNFSGLQPGEQLIRMTQPGAVSSSYGNAYDTEDNSLNFIDILALTVGPKNTTQTASPITGTPATGAVVNVNDYLSNSSICTATTVAGYPVCSFSIVVATGSWTMDLSLNGAFAQIQNVSVSAGVSTGVPNGSTSPTWTSVGNNSTTLLTGSTIYALVSGYVRTSANVPLSGIKVSDGNGRSVYSATNGSYSLAASTGIIELTGNPNDANMNRTYVSQSLTPQTMNAGTLYDNQNFYLEYGGIIRGYFKTSSNTPLPGRVATATKTVGTETAQAASDNTGYFYLQGLSTGTYTVAPSLDPMETSSPPPLTVVLASTGITTSVSTFTITSGIAEISGQVVNGSDAITTGVLLVASPNTILTSLPPTQYGSSGSACNPCYYMGSSDATGRYDIQVRSSTSTYHLYAWYTTITGNTVSTTKKGPYDITVSTPGMVASQPISWP